MVQREKLEAKILLQERVLETFRTKKCTKVQELVDLVQKSDRTLSTEEIREAIEAIEDNGTLRLVEPSIQEASFFEYLRNNRASNLHFWTAIAVVAFTVATVYLIPKEIFASGSIMNILRVAFGTAVVLLIPGYGLSYLLFAKKKGSLSALGHLAVGLGLSLAMVPVLWLALQNTPSASRFDLTILVMSIAGIALNFGGMYRQFQTGKRKHPATLQSTGVTINAPATNPNEKTATTPSFVATPSSTIDQRKPKGESS